MNPLLLAEEVLENSSELCPIGNRKEMIKNVLPYIVNTRTFMQIQMNNARSLNSLSLSIFDLFYSTAHSNSFFRNGFPSFIYHLDSSRGRATSIQ